MHEVKDVPYIVHEGEMARMERFNHRLWVVIIILIVALLATNTAWIVYENQWETSTTTETYEIDSGEGGHAVYNESGEVNINGKDTQDQEDAQENTQDGR